MSEEMEWVNREWVGKILGKFAHKMAIIAIYALYHMFFQEIQGNTIFGVSYVYIKNHHVPFFLISVF